MHNLRPLSRYERFIREISQYIFKIGTKLDSKAILWVHYKLLDYIAERHGCPKDAMCWIHMNTIDWY